MRTVDIAGKQYQVEEEVAARIQDLESSSRGPKPGEIYGAIIAVAAEIGAIGKEKQCTGEYGFKYRGIDQFYNAASPLFAKHGIFSVPEILEREDEPYSTKNGGTWHRVILKIRYTFYAKDGSSVSAIVYGEGCDSGDKGSNKAEAAAHKYALMQILCVPTEELKADEPDGHMPPEATKVEPKKVYKPTAPPPPPAKPPKPAMPAATAVPARPAPAATEIPPSQVLQDDAARLRSLPTVVQEALRTGGYDSVKKAAAFCSALGWDPEEIWGSLGTKEKPIADQDKIDAAVQEYREVIETTSLFNLNKGIRKTIAENPALTAEAKKELNRLIDERIKKDTAKAGAGK